MKNGDEFYLTLLSNSSIVYYPNNTTTKFTTQLPRRFTLIGDWSVGIAEIQYPCSFLSVAESDNLIYYRPPKPEKVEGDQDIEIVLKDAHRYFNDSNQEVYNSGGWCVVRIATGNYERIEDIIKAINKHKILGKIVKFEYNKASKKVSLSIEPSVTALGCSQRLALQLGYKPHANLVQNPTPSHPANIWVGIPSQMFVYCDLVEPQAVGDVLSPLMRIVNITADNYNYGSHKDVIFSPPHYIPVMRREFENVEIDIRTDSGELMPFEFGTLSLKLHFKKIHV